MYLSLPKVDGEDDQDVDLEAGLLRLDLKATNADADADADADAPSSAQEGRPWPASETHSLLAVAADRKTEGEGLSDGRLGCRGTYAGKSPVVEVSRDYFASYGFSCVVPRSVLGGIFKREGLLLKR